MKKMLFLIAIFFAALTFGQKQSTPWCTVGEYQQGTGDFSSKNTVNRILTNTRLNDPNGLIIIPVVFHILYNPNIPEQNISEAFIHSQLERLNADIRMLNADIGLVPPVWQPLAADLNFSFKLACVDPNGIFTNGIVRKPVNNNYIFCNIPSSPTPIVHCVDARLSALNGDDAWPTDRYLNIWVFNMEDAGGISGASTFPWECLMPNVTVMINGNPVSIERKNLDGIILDYRVVGNPVIAGPSPFPGNDRGRVLTHEVGHWLGLFHTYQRGSADTDPACFPPGDFVDDTPPQFFYTANCTTAPLNDLCSLAPGPGIMFMNYMDGTPDVCRYFFTAGQRDRARRYFAELGPLGTRYPNIQNYFSIKDLPANPYTVQNNTITIYVDNPACLDVVYTVLSGPVTVLHSNNSQIVFSVPCNTNGTVHLMAQAGLGLPGVVNNYIDEYEFQFVNPTPCSPWPKKYFWYDSDLFPGIGGEHSLVTKGKNGNLFYSIGSVSFNNNFNHIGPPPASNNSNFLIHYNSTGITNWVKDNLTDLADVFVMNNGHVRTKISNISPNYIYLDESSGGITSGPLYVPSDEKILAETTSGTYITYKNAQLFVRTSTTSTSILQSVVYAIFNKNTNRLFIQEVIYPDVSGNLSGVIKIFDLVNGSLQSSNISVPSLTGHVLYHVDNSDNIYTLDMQCGSKPIYKFEYQTLNYSPLLMTNFVNNNVLAFKRPDHLDDPYASNSFAVITYESNNRYTNVLDFSINANKKILGTSNTNNSCSSAQGWGFNNYIIEGDNLYMTGQINMFGDPVVIGTQTITPVPPLSWIKYTNFITKFSIQNDLNRSTTTFAKIKGFDFFLSPNPVTSSLTVRINETAKCKDKMGLYLLEILDKSSIVLSRRIVISSSFEQGISNLQSGLYYIMITSSKGEKITKQFVKL